MPDDTPSVYVAMGDPVGRIFLEEEDGALHGYSATGSILPGWPQQGPGGQERHTPAIGDLDGDGEPEVVTCSGSLSSGVLLFAYHLDGSPLAGFPVNIEPRGFAVVDSYPAIGDIDGDGINEIIVPNSDHVLLYHGDGSLVPELPITGSYAYGTAPALGDLDHDGHPEIVIQTDNYLDAFRFNGSQLPGFPVPLGDRWRKGDSAPVIGDVDGDRFADIALTLQVPGSRTGGEVRVYHSNGALVAGFPKVLPLGSGAVPAIADIDLDRRNELVVTGNYWDGYAGRYPKTWVFDLHGLQYGPVEWGQFMHDAGHTSLYSQPSPAPTGPPLEPRVVPYPNPVRLGGTVRFRIGSLPSAAYADIFDTAGRLIRRQLDPSSTDGWNLRTGAGALVRSGIYVIRVASHTGRIAVMR